MQTFIVATLIKFWLAIVLISLFAKIKKKKILKIVNETTLSEIYFISKIWAINFSYPIEKNNVCTKIKKKLHL